MCLHIQNTFEKQVCAKFRTEEFAPFQFIIVDLIWIGHAPTEVELESEIKVRDFQTSFCQPNIHIFSWQTFLHTQFTFSLSLHAGVSISRLTLCLWVISLNFTDGKTRKQTGGKKNPSSAKKRHLRVYPTKAETQMVFLQCKSLKPTHRELTYKPKKNVNQPFMTVKVRKEIDRCQKRPIVFPFFPLRFQTPCCLWGPLTSSPTNMGGTNPLKSTTS